MIQKIFSGVLLVILVTFMVVNRQDVTLSFYPFPFEVTAPLFLVFAGGLVLGAIIAWVLHLVSAARKRLRPSDKDDNSSSDNDDDLDADVKDL